MSELLIAMITDIWSGCVSSQDIAMYIARKKRDSKEGSKGAVKAGEFTATGEVWRTSTVMTAQHF